MYYLKQAFPLSDKLWEGIDSSFSLSFFKENYFINTDEKKIYLKNNNAFKVPTTFYPIILNYYKKRHKLSEKTIPIFVSTNFRQDWSLFFRGVHSINEDLVLKHIKDSLQFKLILKQFKGQESDIGDASFVLEPLQGVCLQYIFWDGDEDFPPSLKILFDKKLSELFMQDIVWSIIVETNYRISIYEKYFSVFN